METKLFLFKELFSRDEKVLLSNNDFTVFGFKYESGIEAIKICNKKGFIIVLPFYGQIIWDAEFGKHLLKMKNMFSEPKFGNSIVDTYGCFAFHSGLIRNGCPSPEDDHVLHGEMPCSIINNAWLIIDNNSITLTGEVEYVKGFGNHYSARPAVTLYSNSTLFDIQMSVTNLSSVDMPLQYMCHMNYCYEHGAVLTQNIPDEAIVLRETIPAHVSPTEKWLEFNDKIKKGEYHLNKLRYGIFKKYYKDTEKMSSTSTVMVNREKVDGVERMSFVLDGETKVFREDGTLMAILQYKDGSLQDLTQKFYYPNGKIKYYIVAASDDMKDFKVKDRIITYYENGKVKQDCNQQNDGSWLCKNYDENGKFLDEEIRGAEPISNGDTKFWENILNPVLEVLAN